VGRVLAAAVAAETELDDDDDLTDEERVRVNACEDGYPPPPPFTYVGSELVVLESREYDMPRTVQVQRFVDGNGRSCSTLDIYRAVMAMEAADNWEGHRGDDVYADLARQMERGR
jgi:hypothetical protein